RVGHHLNGTTTVGAACGGGRLPAGTPPHQQLATDFHHDPRHQPGDDDRGHLHAVLGQPATHLLTHPSHPPPAHTAPGCAPPAPTPARPPLAAACPWQPGHRRAR